MILLIRMIISKKKASLYILSLSVPIETQYPMLPNGNCSSYFPLTHLLCSLYFYSETKYIFSSFQLKIFSKIIFIIHLILFIFLYFDRKPIEFFFTECVGFRTQDFWVWIARFIPLGYTLITIHIQGVPF